MTYPIQTTGIQLHVHLVFKNCPVISPAGFMQLELNASYRGSSRIHVHVKCLNSLIIRSRLMIVCELFFFPRQWWGSHA